MTNGRTFAVVVVAALAGLFTGAALGRRAAFQWVVMFERGHTENDLRTTVETLAHLRTGNSEMAIQGLEETLDAKISTLPRSMPWSELPGMLRHTYMIGKAYRVAYPPEASNPELERAIAAIPLPERRNLTPALIKALEAAER